MPAVLHRIRRPLCLLLVLAAAGTTMAAPAPALGVEPLPQAGGAPLPVTKPQRAWRNPHFVYKAEGKRVTEVLQDFAASQGLPAVIADGIEGTVQASFDTTPQRFLDAMTRAYGVVWYHDGIALYFSPASSVQSRLLRLKGIRRQQLMDMLDSLQIGDRRFPLRFNDAESTLLVYGPPRHLELIASAIESLEAGASERNRKTVRVVPLRFASAADRVFGQTHIQGLASTLTSLYGGGGGGGGGGVQPAAGENRSPTGSIEPEKLRALQGVLGRDNRLGDALARTPGLAQDAAGPKKQAGAPAGREQRAGADDDVVPVFQPDEGTNSIAIYGNPQRMAEYVEVIHRLDVQPVLIELEATIIDVSSDSVESLGIDWNLRGKNGSFGVSQPANSASNGTFTISTLWSNAGRELLARIDALSAKGKARVVAKPKVLGVANRSAVMREKRVVMVKVAGNLEANLFQIEAGTLLQVTPQMTTVADANGVSTRIKLSLYIEDGSFEPTSIDNIPVVKRTEIMTEAHVGEGESLLIGGITTTTYSNQLDEVPGLGRVPIAGALFRRRNEIVGQSERLFLITPRVIREPVAVVAAPVAPAVVSAPVSEPTALPLK